MSNQEHSYLQTGMSLLNTGIQAFLQNKQLDNNKALGIVGLHLEKDKIDGLQRLSDLQARLSIVKTKADISKNNYIAQDSANAFEDNFNTAYTAYLKDTGKNRDEASLTEFKKYYNYESQREAYDTNIKKYTDINDTYTSAIDNLLSNYFGNDSVKEVSPIPAQASPVSNPYKINNNVNNMNLIDNIVAEPKKNRVNISPNYFIDSLNGQTRFRPSPFLNYINKKNLWGDHGKPRF